VKEPKMEKGMKGTDGLSGLPEDPGHSTQDLVRYNTKEGKIINKIHEPGHGKIGPDWKPVNWVRQGKIRG
jgi:hypothetical protein